MVDHNKSPASNVSIILTIFTWWLISFVILALLNLSSIYNILVNNQGSSKYYLSDALDAKAAHAIHFFDRLSFAPALSTILFWLLAGMIIFGLFVALISLFQTLRHEKELVINYVLPNGAKRSTVAINLAFYWILRIIIIVMSLFSVGILFIFTLPLSKEMFLAGLNQLALSTAAGLLLATIVLMVNLRIIVWLSSLLWRSLKST